MKIRLESHELPFALADVMKHQRLTLSLTFEVDSIRVTPGEGEFDLDEVGGTVLSLAVTHKQGGGGLDPTVERTRLAVRSMGTHG